MAWYTTGTIAVSGTTVTGTGTNFLDNTQSIGPGQALLIPGSGTVKMYEIASVQSATKLTLKTSAGTIAAGQAYAILSFYTDSVPDFARRLAAQLSYYQSQMDGWQQIMTGTGSITMTAPDGTTVTISSFSKLTTDIGNALQQRGRPTAFTDVNNIGPDANGLGIWNFQASSDYNMANLPEVYPGVLEVFAAGNNAGTQRYTTARGTVYVRAPSATWNAASPAWNEWFMVSMATNSAVFSNDLNTLTSAGRYTISGSATNTPIAITGVLEVTRYAAGSTTVQQLFKTVSGQAALLNRVFTRTLSGTTWSAWAESLTTNSFGTSAGTAAQGNDARLNTVNNKSGGTISSAVAVSSSVTAAASNGLAVAAGENNRVEINNTASGGSTGNPVGWAVFRWYNELAQAGIRRAGDTTIQSYFIALSGGGSWEFNRGGNAAASGSWTNGSDERHKSNIKTVKDALASVLSWRGATYDKMDGASEVGLIAQDVEKACPIAISTNGNRKFMDGTVIPDFKNLNTSGAAAAYHTEAIKALFSLVELLALDKPEVLEMVDKIKASVDEISSRAVKSEPSWKEEPPVLDVPSNEEPIVAEESEPEQEQS